MAKPRVNIGCPQHGGLNPPYKTTVIHVGESEVSNITCAFCPQCDAYYTTAMAIPMGVADPIDDRRVKRGVMFNKEKHDPSYSVTYEASPVLKRGQRASGMPKDELKKPKKSTQYGSEPVFRADKRPKPLPKVTGYVPKRVEPRANVQPTKLEVLVPKVEEFYVADRWLDEETGTCPECNSRIYARQYNIPVYGEDNRFYAYYAAQLLYCTRCHKYVMAENEFRSFTRKINAPARKNHVRPKNMTGRYDS